MSREGRRNRRSLRPEHPLRSSSPRDACAQFCVARGYGSPKLQIRIAVRIQSIEIGVAKPATVMIDNDMIRSVFVLWFP